MRAGQYISVCLIYQSLNEFHSMKATYKNVRNPIIFTKDIAILFGVLNLENVQTELLFRRQRIAFPLHKDQSVNNV